MRCMNCYQEIPDSCKFCPNCGAKQPVQKMEPVSQVKEETTDNITEDTAEVQQPTEKVQSEEDVLPEEKVQPEENVQVYIPIPEKMKLFAYLGKTKIYRVEADGTLTEMDVKIKNGGFTFETSHFIPRQRLPKLEAMFSTSSFKSTITTFSCFSINFLAVASPIPLAPPVIIVTFSFIVSLSLLRISKWFSILNHYTIR